MSNKHLKTNFLFFLLYSLKKWGRMGRLAKQLIERENKQAGIKETLTSW